MTHRFTPLAPVLMAAQDTPDQGVPDWVHLLPSDTAITTLDGRGPYRVADADSMIAASFAAAPRLPIDENHATDLAAPQGLPAPARGWITEMQARSDGIWGRVEWTEAGRALVADRAYRAISPVINHDKGRAIQSILRASLVNRPNLRGLTALNQETPMTLIERLAARLGLQATATEDEVLAAIPETGTSPALQSALTEIGTALGVVGGDSAAILAAARTARMAAAGGEAIPALQQEIATLTTRLNDVTGTQSRVAAEAFVDGEIRKGRAGVKPLRDHYIAMHQADPARVQMEIAALPILGPSGTITTPPVAQDGEIALNAAQITAARLLGIPAKDYAATLKAERTNEEFL